MIVLIYLCLFLMLTIVPIALAFSFSPILGMIVTFLVVTQLIFRNSREKT